jgi:predicted dehydrogenase
VGLQGSFAPVIKQIKSIIDSGEIGKIESSNILSKTRGGPVVSSHVDYMTNRHVGGNIFTIGFGHTLEFIRGGKKELQIITIFFI